MINKVIRYFGYAIVSLFLIVVAFALAWYRSDIPVAELESEYFTAESSYTKVRGNRIHIRKRGTGPVIFLIHGSFASLHTWNAWEQQLSLSNTSISLDLPGHGLSGPSPTQSYTTDDYENLIIELANVMKIDTFSIAGNSMGGNVAWKVALHNPDRVRKLILVDAAGFERYSNGHRAEQPFIFTLLQSKLTSSLLIKITPKFIFKMNLKQVYGDVSKIGEEDVTRFYRLMLREGNRLATVQRLRHPGRDLQDSIQFIKTPTLILWGENDKWIPVAKAEKFHQAIANSVLRTFAGAGHIPMEEIPDETVKTVLNFLKE